MKSSALWGLALLPIALAKPAIAGRQSSTCGVRGYDSNTQAYSYKEGGSLSTYAGCSAKCAAASKCKSFAFGQGACLLYKKVAANNVVADNESPYIFYDKACTSSVTPEPNPSQTVPNTDPTPSNGPGPVTGDCGILGYDRSAPEAYYHSKKATNGNFAACSALCVKKGCVSFAFGKRACLLYSASVAENVDADGSSPYTFYDATCLAGPVIISSSAAVATSTPVLLSSSAEASVAPSSAEILSSATVSSAFLAPSSSSELTSTAADSSIIPPASSSGVISYESSALASSVPVVPTSSAVSEPSAASAVSSIAQSSIASAVSASPESISASAVVSAGPISSASAQAASSAAPASSAPVSVSQVEGHSTSAAAGTSPSSAPAAVSSSAPPAASSAAPSTVPNNLIRQDPNSFWGGWNVALNGNARLVDGVVDNNGQPAGAIASAPPAQRVRARKVLRPINAGAWLTYDNFTITPGLQYTLSVQVKVDVESMCFLDFRESRGSYLYAKVPGDADNAIPRNEWTTISGSFFGEAGQGLTVQVWCDGVSPFTVSFSQWRLLEVSQRMYSVGDFGTGPNVVVNSGFDTNEAWSFNEIGGVTHNFTSDQGFEGTPGLQLSFPRFYNEFTPTEQRVDLSQNIPTIKGKVYVMDVDILIAAVSDKLAPNACIGGASMTHGAGWFLPGFDFNTHKLSEYHYSHFAALFIAPASSVSITLSVWCTGNNLNATVFGVDRFTFTPLS